VLSTNQAIAKYLNTGAAAMMLNNNGQINSNITKEAMPNMITMAFPATPICVEPKSSTEADVTNLVYASAKAYKDPVKKQYIDKLIIKLVDKTAGKMYVEKGGVTVPHLGLQIDEALVPKFVIDADAVAAKQIGNKWLLSFVAAKNRNTIRELVNDVWYGKLTAEQFRDGLQNGLYGK
jgi:hypothetical protein